MRENIFLNVKILGDNVFGRLHCLIASNGKRLFRKSVEIVLSGKGYGLPQNLTIV